jgi:hypothetical protein
MIALGCAFLSLSGALFFCACVRGELNFKRTNETLNDRDDQGADWGEETTHFGDGSI